MKKFLRNTRQSLRNARTRLMVGGTALVASGAALAQTVGGDAAASISASSSDVELVQTALMGILVLLVVFALIRKSLGK